MNQFASSRFPLFIAGSIALLFACGGRVEGIGDSSATGSCEGSTFSYCGGDNKIETSCCSAGDPCAPPAAYCDFGNARCTQGACTNGNGTTRDGSGSGNGSGGDIDASIDATVDSTAIDADGTDTPCGDKSCFPWQTCVVTTSGGGPCILPDDGGVCPNGQPSNGQCCDNTTTVAECKPTPANCGGADLSCSCASTLCECGGCELAQAPNTVQCSCEFP